MSSFFPLCFLLPAVILAHAVEHKPGQLNSLDFQSLKDYCNKECTQQKMETNKVTVIVCQELCEDFRVYKTLLDGQRINQHKRSLGTVVDNLVNPFNLVKVIECKSKCWNKNYDEQDM